MGVFPVNSTLTFSVASGSLTPDPVTGNFLPSGSSTVQLRCYLRPSSPPKSLYYPALDEQQEFLSGYVQEIVGTPGTPAELPNGIGNGSKGWCELDNLVTGTQRSGWFVVYRGTSSPFKVESILGTKISGVWLAVATGSGVGAQTPLPAQGLYPAATSIAAHKVVALISGQLVLANQSNIGHVDAIAGITLNAVSTGGKPQYIRSGYVSDPGWNFTPLQPIYLGTNGNITQNYASLTSGFVMQVGWVESPTKIWFDIGETVIL